MAINETMECELIKFSTFFIIAETFYIIATLFLKY